MRSCLIILALLTGCASAPKPAPPSAVSLAELKSIKLTNRDCPRIDQWVNYAETQLRRRGLLNKNPEDLSGEDREYNATARIMVWSLRIGCANPDRYAK